MVASWGAAALRSNGCIPGGSRSARQQGLLDTQSAMQQQQAPQKPRVLYRRPTSVGVPQSADNWDADEAGAAAAAVAQSPAGRGTSAPSPYARPQRAASQHVVWAKDAISPISKPPSRPRPASAGSIVTVAVEASTAAVDAANAAAASGSGGKADCYTADFSCRVGGGASGSSSCGHGPRTFGGSPSLNAAAAALAERHALVDAQGNMRPQEQGQGKRCRDVGGGGGGGVGGGGGSSSSGLRKDVESLSEDIRRLRGELVASHEQNRLLRTERQRMEEELHRCRANLIRAEELLSNSRERSLSPNTGGQFRTPATTSLVIRLKEQLAAQQNQNESLREQLDDVMKGTRATRVAELQSEVRAQEQELRRQGQMVRVMRRRMEEAEARTAEVLDRGLTTGLQQPITATEAKHSVSGASAPTPTSGHTTPIPVDSVTDVASHRCNNPKVSSTVADGTHGSVLGGSPPSSSSAALMAAVVATITRQSPSSPSTSATAALTGGQTLSSGRIKRTMAALGDAHRALLSQATLLTELLPPGLTTEQLCMRAALRPATWGAPEVLRYLRHHVHKMVDVLSVLPGNRLEMKREEDEDAAVPGTGGKGVTANGHANRSGTNGNNGTNGRGARGTLLNNMSGQGLRPAAVAAAKGCSGDDGNDSGGVVAPEAEFDPWALLSELLDFVRWLRGLDSASLETRPDLEGGLEQLSSVVGICDLETRRLLGRMEGAVAGNGA